MTVLRIYQNLFHQSNIIRHNKVKLNHLLTKQGVQATTERCTPWTLLWGMDHYNNKMKKIPRYGNHSTSLRKKPRDSLRANWFKRFFSSH